MSHIVEIRTEFRDQAAIMAACARLKLDMPTTGTFRLYGESATGLGVQLKGWKFPVVVDLKTGRAQYDNYGGTWGKPAHLDAFKQAYAIEKAKIEARKKGYTCAERVKSDGSIELAITTGR